MLKETKHVIYLLTIFVSVFFIIKFYLSEHNIKRSNKVIFQYQKGLDKKFDNLPIIKNDTNNIIEYTDEIEKFENEKPRIWWELLIPNEK